MDKNICQELALIYANKQVTPELSPRDIAILYENAHKEICDYASSTNNKWLF